MDILKQSAIAHRFVLGVSATAIAFVMVTGSALASGAISQGFSTTEEEAMVGSLVDLQSTSQNTAELATSDRSDQLLGVVGKKALVQLGDGTEQLEVITSGQTVALVSDINGDIKLGDKITASPIKGVGMKATRSSTIVGTAQSAFDESKSTTQTITDKEGQKRTVHIGLVPLQVNVVYFMASQDKLSPLVPSFLQTLSNTIAGHNVTALRVLIGFIILLIGFVSVTSMLFSATRAGLIAIGRNPLAQNALRKGFFQVIMLAFGILLITLLIVYVILAV